MYVGVQVCEWVCRCASEGGCAGMGVHMCVKA